MIDTESADYEEAWRAYENPEYGWRRMGEADWHRFGGLGSPFGLGWEDPCFSALTGRKCRLFAVACCRRIWSHIPDGDPQRIIEVMERVEDGAAEWEIVRRFYECPKGLMRAEKHALAAVAACCRNPDSELAATVAHECARVQKGSNAYVEECRAQCDLLRDILSNPFRPALFDASWRTDTVELLSQAMYASREFSAMPILADALQDAGCDNEDILTHCRGPGPHVRGCWVVDLVLGKK